jgi:hypothetical protein
VTMTRIESKLSEQEWSQWLDPFCAIQMLKRAGLEDDERAVGWLAARLEFGELRGAGYAIMDSVESDSRDIHLGVHPTTVWSDIVLISWKHDFWVSGTYVPTANDHLVLGIRYARSEQQSHIPRYTHLLHKVRFEPDLITWFCDQRKGATSTGIGTQVMVKKPAGGRPPKPFWDELWASIAAQMFNGDFKPDKQADIEKAMHDWLGRNSKNAGETAVRAKARLLWAALNEEVTN